MSASTVPQETKSTLTIRGKYGIVNYEVQIKQTDFRLADVITWDEPHGNLAKAT